MKLYAERQTDRQTGRQRCVPLFRLTAPTQLTERWSGATVKVKQMLTVGYVIFSQTPKNQPLLKIKRARSGRYRKH